MAVSVNKFISVPLDHNKEALCAFCLEDDQPFKVGRIYLQAPEHLRDQSIQHLRGDKTCQKVHAACMRAAAQLAVRNGIGRPMHCPGCIQPITHINDVPLAPYLQLDRLPEREPGQIEEMEGLGEIAQADGLEGQQEGQQQNQELVGFWDMLSIALRADGYAAGNQELGERCFEIIHLIDRNARNEEVFEMVRNFPQPELGAALTTALCEAARKGNIPLLQALLQDDDLSRNITAEMRGKAIVDAFEYKNYRNIPAQRMRHAYIVDLLLPRERERIPGNLIGKAVCKAIDEASVRVVKRLLRHAEISEPSRGAALKHAISYSQHWQGINQQLTVLRLLFANGPISKEVFVKELSFAIRAKKDIRIIQEIFTHAELSKEEKSSLLETAIMVENREVVQYLSRDLSFKQRLSAIWFAANRSRGGYSDLADGRIKTLFVGAMSLSAYILGQRIWENHFGR